MSRDTILKDKDGNRYSYDNLSTQKWLDGHRPGALAVVAWLREKAVDLFRQGKDDAAVQLRKLAEDATKEVIPKLEAQASEHLVEFPIQLEKSK